MWIVGTARNEYATPKEARLAWNPETNVWKVAKSLMWLVEGAGVKVRVPGEARRIVTREEDPEVWLASLGPNYYRGAHLAFSLKVVENLEDLPPLSEAVLTEHPGHGSQKVHGRRFGKIADRTDAGGYSANWIGHEPRSGYMVGGVVPPVHLDPPLGVTASGKLTPLGRKALAADIKRFVEKNRETLRKPGMYLGTWKDDDGSIYLDVSQRMATRSGALSHGAARGEIAIYDVRRGDSINVPEGQTTRGIPDQYDLGAMQRSLTSTGGST